MLEQACAEMYTSAPLYNWSWYLAVTKLVQVDFLQDVLKFFHQVFWQLEQTLSLFSNFSPSFFIFIQVKTPISFPLDVLNCCPPPPPQKKRSCLHPIAPRTALCKFEKEVTLLNGPPEL